MTALLLAVLAATPFQPAPADPAAAASVLQRIYAVSSRAMVQVGDDPLRAGTVLTESGIIATTADGLAGRRSIGITFSNGFHATADVVALDADTGVALLHAAGLPAMAYLKLSANPVQEGQAAYSGHFAGVLRSTVTFARVQSARVSRNQRIDDRYFTAHFGLAGTVRGGPVVSYGGEVIGVLLASDTGGIGFAINSRALLAFIGQHAAALPTSELQVATDPSGSQVLLDGKVVARTPATVENVPAGEHLLAFRAPGIPDVLRRLVALGPAKDSVEATLFPGAPVHISAPKGTRLYVDGILRAVGPSVLWLPGGAHVLQAALSGFRPYSRQLEVVEDRPLALEVALVEQHATLSLTSNPPGAEVTLDDNRIGQTPLQKVRVPPGTYQLTLSRPGFHTLTRPVQVADGVDVNLGAFTLESPHLSLAVHAPPGSDISIDRGPRHGVQHLEAVPPGRHTAVIFAPYQYAVVASFHGEDGETVQLAPVFVAAGNPRSGEVPHVLASISQGASGILALVATGFFVAAESDRESNGGQLSSSGHGQLNTGLITGGVGLGLYAASLFIDSLQPTPEMGFGRTASGAAINLRAK